MKRTSLIIAVTLALAAGIVLGVMAVQGLNAQEKPLKASAVFRADVEDMERTEVIVQVVEFAPRGSSGKHVHPGHEVAYVLSGSGTSEAEGRPTVTRSAGTVTYLPATSVHETKNDSATEPLKLLVFRIHPKGQEITTRRVTEPYFLH